MTAALHAVLIGVSAYPHLPNGGGAPAPKSFGLKQLSSSALSAFRMHEWLTGAATKLPLPLGSVELLVSPSAGELAAEPRLAGRTPATRAEVVKAMKSLKAAAANDLRGMTLFYFAGHGIQRTTQDGVLLLADFGDPNEGTLAKAVELTNLVAGMAPSPSAPNMALTQVWFVDACRTRPEELSGFEKMTVPDVFDVELGGVDNRKAPIFFATVPGALAYSRKNKETVFSSALLRGLAGAAARMSDEEDANGRVKWRVTVQSLNLALDKHLPYLAGVGEGVQEFTLGGQCPGDPVIAELESPPSLELEVTLDPEAAKSAVGIEVCDSAGQSVDKKAPPIALPYRRSLSAGVYAIHAEAPAGAAYKSFRGEPRPLSPPRVTCVRRVR
jgi:hypothetical protein